jgi:N-acetylmuramoyl-L-alanine amidase
LGLGINTIVIDPGHGGKDPGAIGKSGLMEKDVVLDIALKLRNLLEKQLSKRVILTRESDVFIPLDERTLIANAKKADLFISIHTNSSPKKKTRGVEIYLVGQSTDRTAMATAARENSASERAMSDLEVILNDLLENTKIDESLELAHTTRRSFLKTVGAHYNHTVDLGVKRAPFYVLINANMPSILAEVAFISNPTEEQRLSNETYRQRIAEALFEGIRDYIASIKVASS